MLIRRYGDVDLALSAALPLLPPLLLQDVELAALLELQDGRADRSAVRGVCKENFV